MYIFKFKCYNDKPYTREDIVIAEVLAEDEEEARIAIKDVITRGTYILLEIKVK